MKTEALVQKVHNATPEEQKLIAQILEAPEPVKHSMSEALSEIKKKTLHSQLLQDLVEVAVEVSKATNIPADIYNQTGSFEAIVKVFTLPEALKALAPSDPLAAARLRGVLVKHDLLYGDGQPFTSEEVAQMLHITRQAVDKRRSKGQLLGVSLGRRGYHYPTWQFHEGKVLSGLERVLHIQRDHDSWTQLMFLKTGDIRLRGATPLERLQAGEIDAVVWAAQCYGHHGAA